MRYLRHSIEIDRLVDMLLDILHDAVDARNVFLFTQFLRSHIINCYKTANIVILFLPEFTNLAFFESMHRSAGSDTVY